MATRPFVRCLYDFSIRNALGVYPNNAPAAVLREAFLWDGGGDIAES